MGAGEASSYLAEILEGTEEEGQRIGTHSLKVTLLTWASRSTVVRLSKNERLLQVTILLLESKVWLPKARGLYEFDWQGACIVPLDSLWHV